MLTKRGGSALVSFALSPEPESEEESVDSLEIVPPEGIDVS